MPPLPRLLLLCGTALLLPTAMANDRLPWGSLSLPGRTRQVILVLAPTADASTGTLQPWERPRGSSWKPSAPPHPVALGRAGLAWGLGLHSLPLDAPLKKEGDGKAPAGIFRLGTAFGSASQAVPGSLWPFRQATEHDFWIDDPASALYNRWLHSRRDPAGSFERLLREDGLYRLGLVVEHNTSPSLPGQGSAIFLHLWKGPGQPTAGCTAMAEADLLALLRWLHPGHHPLFIQVPKPWLKELKL